MKSSLLNRIVFMSLMVVITVMGLGKVTLPFLENTSKEMMAEKALSSIETDILAETHHEVLVTPMSVWLASDLIPSVEAAEGMPLAEENDGNAASAAKVIALREKQKQLNDREKALNEREGEVQEAEKRAQDKIKQLEQLEARIQNILTEEKSIKDKKIKRLTTVYEGMKAERAAPVIAQMDLGIVVKIFSRMSEKQVGKILMFLPPKKAVIISQALTKRIASVK
ncbi:MAG: hypothetical protein R8M46_00520 [Ghiorsea sp.]